MSLPAALLLASALAADPCAPRDRAALAAEFARAVRLGQGLGADQVFVLTLVVDAPEAMHYVAASRLAEWKVPWATARADALANLRALEAAPFVPLAPGCWSGPGGDDVYAASRLLLGDEVRKLVGGDAVATVPSQTAVFVCRAGDAAALAKLAEVTEEALARPRAVSAMPMRIPAEGGLEPFVPVAGDPAHRPLHRLRLLELAQVYEQDKQRLEAELQAAGRDVFVGSFKAMKRPDGDYLSVAVLTVGVHTLFPEVDAVVFVDPGGGGVFASAPFAAALRVLGPAAVRLPGYPPRWEVRELPPVAALKKLGRIAGL